MGDFDSFADAAFLLKREGESITLNFKPGVPTTGQGTVEWNIPEPAHGCQTEDGRGVYAGLVVVADTKPIRFGDIKNFVEERQRERPTDGTSYKADPTVDSDLHTGDRIGDALVVGAVYERDKVAQGEELTTSLVLNDVDSNTPYYIAAFAVDGQFRYHSDGVRAYSDTYGDQPANTRPSVQFVRFERDERFLDGNVHHGLRGHHSVHSVGGVLPTDGTGLTAGKKYEFDIEIDDSFPEGTNKRTVLVSVDGQNAETYQDLLDEINKQLAQAENPLKSPVEPDKGRFFWDAKSETLFQWDGNEHIEQEDAFIENEDPAVITTADFWFDVDDDQLRNWNGVSWDDVPTIKHNEDPTNLTGCDDYWLNTSTFSVAPSQEIARRWEPNTWCEEKLFNQTNDPSERTKPECNAYWFDTDDEILYNWNEKTCKWDQVFAIMWHEDPNSLSDGTFWFDDTNTLLKIRDVSNSQWLIVNQKGTQPVVSYPDASTIVIPGDFANTFVAGADVTIQGGENQTGSPYTVDTDATYDGTNTTIPIVEVLTDTAITQDRVVTGTLEQKSIATFIQKTKPSNPSDNAYWYDTENELLFQYDAGTDTFNELDVIVWPNDPTDTESCDLWWDTQGTDDLTDDVLKVWDSLNSEWDVAPIFIQSDEDPNSPEDLKKGDTWYNPDTDELRVWDGSQWNETPFIEFDRDPTEPLTGDAWFNTTDSSWQIWDTPTAGQWNTIDPIESDTDPTMIASGSLWFDLDGVTLFERVGSSWVAVPFSTIPFTPSMGDQYFDTSTGMLREWNGTMWQEGTPLAKVSLDEHGLMKFETTFTGSNACIMILVPNDSETGIASDPRLATGKVDHNDSDQNDWWMAGSIWHHFFNHHAGFSGLGTSFTQVTGEQFLFDNLTPATRIQPQVYGDDGVQSLPSYDQIGVGDDGSPDERRELMDSIRAQLGYPVIDVELTTYQLDQAIQGAVENFRKRSSSGYKRGFYFLDINPGIQSYRLTDRAHNFHKIVTITSAHRFTSAFLSTAHGAGAYGQIVLQHLYNMGTYDLTSFHLVSQYIEQLEHLFATRLTFQWDEQARLLHFNHSFVYPEVVLLDCSVERPEQDFYKDRWIKNWIERWAMMEARLILAEIRGKYASLPGAGGGISLNAQDLLSRADQDRAELLEDIDNYQSDNVEEWGMHSTLIIG